MPRTAAPLLASHSPNSPVPRAADSDRRRTNASVILRSVLEHGPVARSTISRLTGLSPASVTDYCARFTELGLIRESATPQRSKGVGRPHVPVDLDASRFVVGGVHVAVPYTTVALLDLRGRVVAERRIGHDSHLADPCRVLARAAEGLDTLLTEAAGATRWVSGSPPAAGSTGTPGPSSTIRCWAGGTYPCANCSAPAPGCRSMWTATHGRW